MSWAEIKKAVNDNLDYPLNRQKYFHRIDTFMTNTTFIVPQNGQYFVTCVGKGGDGSNGGGTTTNYGHYAGAGGGGGAVAKSLLNLQKGEEVTIIVDSTRSSFGDYLSAGAGSNGTGTAQSGVGGAGGVATGGNLLNVDGLPGAMGAGGAGNTSSNADAGGIGGNTGIVTLGGVANEWGGAGYFPFNNITGKVTGGNPGESGLCGGGSGYYIDGYAKSYGGAAFGGGGSGGGKQYKGTVTGTVTGGKGGAGIVIIEYLEEFFGGGTTE